MEKIRIKCPNCGAILAATISEEEANNPANQQKTIKCPICKILHPLAQYKRVKPRVTEEEDRTSLGASVNVDIDDKTQLPEFHNKAVKYGRLYYAANKEYYTLSEGVNLIGRMTYQTVPVATVPIRTEDRGFSRKHINIEVVTTAANAVKYFAYSAENKNITTINGVQLNATDKIALNDGDVIKSSNTELIFRL